MKPKKKLVTSLLAVAGLLVAGSVWANGSGNGIAGSPHDFTDNLSSEAGGAVTETGTGGWNTRVEICRVCHVPHDHQKATKLYENGLLWNHKVSGATYTMYDKSWSSTLNGKQSPQPDGTAKLCLGCHDGTVAIDAFDGNPGTVGNEIQNIYGAPYPLKSFMVPGASSSGDLRGTHPISIEYDTTLETQLHPTTNPMGTSGSIASVLDNGKVQCSSCHDVHDQESVAGTHLLRVAQKGGTNGAGASGLCLTCHKK